MDVLHGPPKESLQSSMSSQQSGGDQYVVGLIFVKLLLIKLHVALLFPSLALFRITCICHKTGKT